MLPALFSGVQHVSSYILVPLTLTHYILAIPYSRRPLGMVCSAPVPSAKLGCLAAFATLLYLAKPSKGLQFVFGFHHVFSEVYLLHENVLSNLRNEATAMRTASVLFNLFAYFIATGTSVRAYPQIQFFLWVGLTISAAANLFFLMRLRPLLTRRQLFEILAFELLPLGFIAVAMLTKPINVSMIVYYHVLFWVFYPCLKMFARKQFKSIGVYMGWNALLLSILLIWAVGVVPGFKMSGQLKGFFFTFGSYFHIFTSLSLTTAQPAFLTKFFNPKLFASSNRPAAPMLGKAAAPALVS